MQRCDSPDKRNLPLPRQVYNLHDMIGALRKNDNFRPMLIHSAVVLIQPQINVGIKNIRIPGNGPQPPLRVRVDHHLA